MKKYMKKFVENLDLEIVLVTTLLISSIVAYYFELNFNWILLTWTILSCAISYIYYRKLQFLADKNKVEKLFIGLSRALFLFIEILFFFPNCQVKCNKDVPLIK